MQVLYLGKCRMG